MYQLFIEGLQRLGRALMLPIAILPIAGLLLRLGDTDLLNIAIIHDAGQVIFANLAMIFAIGIAVGFAKDNNGTAGLAGVIGYLVMISTLKVLDPSINMGMLAGIVSGLMAGRCTTASKTSSCRSTWRSSAAGASCRSSPGSPPSGWA